MRHLKPLAVVDVTLSRLGDASVRMLIGTALWMFGVMHRGLWRALTLDDRSVLTLIGVRGYGAADVWNDALGPLAQYHRWATPWC